MNDVDFDELDKAVANALAGGKNSSKPDLIVHSPQMQPGANQPAPQQDMGSDMSTDTSDAAPAANDMPPATIGARTVPTPPKPEPENEGKPDLDHEEDLPAKLSEVAPLAPTLPTPMTMPASSSPATPRPKGKFMDIAPPGTGTKALMNSSKTKLTPLASEDFTHSSAPMSDVSPPQKPKVMPLTPDFTDSQASHDDAETPKSPFVPDVSVEKRPLGAFGVKPDEKSDEKQEESESDALARPPSKDESALGPEMSQEIIALEEDEDGFRERVRDAVDTSTPPFTPPVQEEVKTPEPPEEPEESSEVKAKEPAEPVEDQVNKTMPLHFDALEQEEPAPHPHDPFAKESAVIAPETSQESRELSAESEPEATSEVPEPEAMKEEPKSESPTPAVPPLLKSLPEKEVPAGGSIVQQHSGETTTPLTKSWPTSPQVPLLSAENYHPVTHEHHTPWWVWLLVIIGVLAFGAATGAAVFMWNPGLF